MIDFGVLGPIEVSTSTGELSLGGPKQRRLMALLIVNANAVVPTDQLMELLWEGRPPEGAKRSFKAYVARLRSALAEGGAAGLIVTHKSGYTLQLDRD